MFWPRLGNPQVPNSFKNMLRQNVQIVVSLEASSPLCFIYN